MKDLLFLILGTEECFQVKGERKKLRVYLYKVHAYHSCRI